MENLFNLSAVAPAMATDDYVGFTFFVGCMAMMAASAFFFLSMNSFDNKWRTSILVSGLITFIAAVHYWYMRDYWASGNGSPTFFRYVDWILTVPLMCVEFYLILKAAGATKQLMWKLILLSTVMLVAGYFGEGVYTSGTGPALWGLISGLAYFAIVYEIWKGEASKLAAAAGGAVLSAHKTLVKFVVIGWAIYPIGYFMGYMAGGVDANSLNFIYNIADVLNKIGFCLAIWACATAESKTAK